MSEFKTDKKKYVIILIHLLCIAVGYGVFNYVDIISYNYPWVLALDSGGLLHMYDDFVINYPPLFPIWLYCMKSVIIPAASLDIHFFELLMKSFGIVFHILGSVWLYRKTDSKTALIWAANAALFINAGIWGQADVPFCFLLLLFFWYMREHRPNVVCILFAVMCLLKHQGIYFIFPLLVFLASEKIVRKKKIAALLYGILTGILVWLPFMISYRDMMLPLRVYLHAFQEQAVFSANAANIWLPFNIRYIEGTLLHVLSYVLILFCMLFSVVCYRKTKNLMAVSVLFIFSVFMLTFNQHERYILYPMLLVFILRFLYKESVNRLAYWGLTFSAAISEIAVLFYWNCYIYKSQSGLAQAELDGLLHWLDSVKLGLLYCSAAGSLVIYIYIVIWCFKSPAAKNRIVEKRDIHESE